MVWLWPTESPLPYLPLQHEKHTALYCFCADDRHGLVGVLHYNQLDFWSTMAHDSLHGSFSGLLNPECFVHPLFAYRQTPKIKRWKPQIIFDCTKHWPHMLPFIVAQQQK
jgi:hypothetical protein